MLRLIRSTWAKLIFHSPGAIWNYASAPLEWQRTDAKEKKDLPPPRILAAIVLSHANWNAAENLLSQEESGDWQLTAVDPGEVVCKGDRSKLPAGFSAAKLAGMNLYPLLVADRELNNKPEMDIRFQLGKLHVPAIALESQCEFQPWSRQLEYLQEFYFPDSGHYINFSQPEKITALIRSFLLDQPPPFPAYQGDKDPRPPLLKVVGR
jgi:pimeloyl-ACP methyl ester carboxylesterase